VLPCLISCCGSCHSSLVAFLPLAGNENAGIDYAVVGDGDKGANDSPLNHLSEVKLRYERLEKEIAAHHSPAENFHRRRPLARAHLIFRRDGTHSTLTDLASGS